MRVCFELFGEVRRGDEVGRYSGEVLGEEVEDCFVGVWRRGERGEGRGGRKQGAGKGFVGAGDCDKHFVAAGPDVQVVGGGEKAVGGGGAGSIFFAGFVVGGGDGEFAP